MRKTANPASKAQPPAAPESQSQRRLKYGSNVALSVIVVVLLAGFVIYFGGRHNKRVDFTTGHVYALKPQTKVIVDRLDQPIEIYSLFRAHKDFDYSSPVADLLEEFRHSSKNIHVDQFDPDTQPGKLKDLVDRLSSRYAGEIASYHQALEQFGAARVALSGFSQDEQKSFDEAEHAFPMDSVADFNLIGSLKAAQSLTHSLDSEFSRAQSDIDEQMKAPLPDYRRTAAMAGSMLGATSNLFKQVIGNFGGYKDRPQVPAVWRAYMTNSLPRYIAAQKQVDATLEQVQKLGDLKLDALVRGVRGQAVLVVGRDDVKMLPFEDIWQGDSDRFVRGHSDELRFAGEKEIAGAIAQLEMTKKPKVVFVRAGGNPLTDPRYTENPPFQVLAESLRQYGYDVLEKDLTRIGGQAPTPEPDMKDIADAIWIVIDLPGQSAIEGMPPPSIDDKVYEHLMNGGPTLILARVGTDAMKMSLEPWGVELHTDQLILHQRVESREQAGSLMEKFAMQPVLFRVHEYGDTPITRLLSSLEGIIPLPSPVSISSKAGYHAMPILPIPHDLPTWITSSQMELSPDLSKGDKMVDDANPACAGVVVEKDGGGRLVVIGSLDMAGDSTLTFCDLDLAESTHQQIAAFPANTELLDNAIFWLSKNDSLIAMSPSAMEVPRIKDPGRALLAFWRVGVLIVGLPLLVIASGLTMYMARRD